ncbi:MAG: peptide-binding protein [Pseudomonadota bacterium]
MLLLPGLLGIALLQSALWVPTTGSRAEARSGRLTTFIQADIGDAKLLNPILHQDAASSRVTTHVFDGLITADENLNLAPELAERWTVTEEAFVAPVPGRTLPNGAPATAANVLAALEAALAEGALPAVQASIEKLEIVPESERRRSETVLRANQKGKAEPLTAEVRVRVPERVRIRLRKVEPRLFEELAKVLGADYFQGAPFADRIRVTPAEAQKDLEARFAEFLPVGEHNPVVTFFLRRDVRFHDGHPFTAEDVKFTYDALVDPKNISPRASSFEAVDRVEVLDPYTVRVVYKRLYSPSLIDWTMGILPKHLLDDAALEREMNARKLPPDARATFSLRNSEFNRRPIGTGPFRFASWRPEEYVELRRFDGYWGARPEYERLILRVIPDYVAQELELHAGALDVYQALPHQAERFRSDDRYQYVSGNEGLYTYIGYNLRRPHFRDPRVRRALGMAINVEEIIEYVLYGEGKRATGPYYSNTPYNDPSVKPLPYDPKGALALLEEAGYRRNAQGWLEKDGKVLEFTLITNAGNPQRKAILSIAQEAWRKIGVRCTTQVFEWTVFLEQFVHPRNFDAIVLGWVGGDINPDKYQIWHSSQGDKYELNHAGYSSPEADRLIEEIRQEYDPERQIQLARQLHRRIAEDQPYTFLYEPLRPYVLDRRIVVVNRKADGSEAYAPIEPTPSGQVDYYFERWRKLPSVPEFSQ